MIFRSLGHHRNEIQSRATLSAAETLECSPGDAEIVKGLIAEHIAAMIIKEACTANHAGARVRALELLGKWKGAFVERYEDVTKRAADQRLRTPAKTRPAPANQLAPLPGVGLDL